VNPGRFDVTANVEPTPANNPIQKNATAKSGLAELIFQPLAQQQ
jgi:hypothetical protein